MPLIIFTHLPPGPLITSTTPATPSESRSPRARTHTRTAIAPQLLRLITSPSSPPAECRTTPAHAAQFSPTLPHLCSPAPALSFPCPSQNPSWQRVMNGTTLLLSSVGLVQLLQPISPVRPSVCLSLYLSVCLCLGPGCLKTYGTMKSV